MASDILLNGENDDWVTINGAVVNVKASDLIIDADAFHTDGGGPFRRALVHTEDDGLAVNFEDDYPGGTKIRGARLRLWIQPDSALPKEGSVGELILTFKKDPASITGGETALWLCVGNRQSILGGNSAVWAPLALGDPVDGSA